MHFLYEKCCQFSTVYQLRNIVCFFCSILPQCYSDFFIRSFVRLLVRFDEPWFQKCSPILKHNFFFSLSVHASGYSLTKKKNCNAIECMFCFVRRRAWIIVYGITRCEWTIVSDVHTLIWLWKTFVIFNKWERKKKEIVCVCVFEFSLFSTWYKLLKIHHHNWNTCANMQENYVKSIQNSVEKKTNLTSQIHNKQLC